MEYLKLTLRYLRPFTGHAIVSILVTLLSAVVGLAAPWPLKLLVDSVLGEEPLPPTLAHLLGTIGADRFWLLLVLVIAGFLIVVVQNALGILGKYAGSRLELGMVLDYRADLLARLQRHSLKYHEDRRVAGLMFELGPQSMALGSMVTTTFPLIQSALTLIGMFVVAFTIDRTLALMSLAVVPFLYFSIVYYTTSMQPRLKSIRIIEGAALIIIHEIVSMQRVVIAFGREPHEMRRFREKSVEAVDARVSLTVAQTMFSLVVQAITALGTALVLGFGAFQVLRGQLTLGHLLVVLSYLAAIYGPLQTISGSISALQEYLTSLRMTYTILQDPLDIMDRPDARPLTDVKGDLQFENVSFTYTGQSEILTDVSFKAPSGKLTALVGPSGAGKTTLVSLIPRFYDASSGRILIDGVDCRALTLTSLRAAISVVHQEPTLFATTIADNIRYGRLDATHDEVVEAAKAANAHDLIVRLPDGYDTVLGERGARLSGGERQRISVARAFLKDAPILILDEPTASIDSRTESVILDALNRLMAGRTTIMVAHRLSTIRNADLVVVLDQGCVVQQGSPRELARQEGLYQHLLKLQGGLADALIDGPLSPAANVARPSVGSVIDWTEPPLPAGLVLEPISRHPLTLPEETVSAVVERDLTRQARAADLVYLTSQGWDGLTESMRVTLRELVRQGSRVIVAQAGLAGTSEPRTVEPGVVAVHVAPWLAASGLRPASDHIRLDQLAGRLRLVMPVALVDDPDLPTLAEQLEHQAAWRVVRRSALSVLPSVAAVRAGSYVASWTEGQPPERHVESFRIAEHAGPPEYARAVVAATEKSYPLVSIVIVVHNALTFTRMCLESVLSSSCWPRLEVIVVDNASTDGTVALLRDLARDVSCVRLIEHDTNRGFSAATNAGLAAASGDVLVVLNNDVIVTEGWLGRLVQHLRDPAVGAVGPVTNRTGNEAAIATAYRSYGEMCAFAAERAAAWAGQALDVDMLTMFCLALRRDVFESVGPLDESYELGLFEDDDYSQRLRQAGYRLQCAEDVFVHHFEQASFGTLVSNGEYARLHAENRQRFEEKWQLAWKPRSRRGSEEYQGLIDRLGAVVSRAVPDTAVVAVISKGDPKLLELPVSAAYHFPASDDGVYAGYHPSDVFDAVRLVNAAHADGVTHLVIPETSAWWLDHYAGLASHLASAGALVAYEPGTCTIYSLGASEALAETVAEPTVSQAVDIAPAIGDSVDDHRLLKAVG